MSPPFPRLIRPEIAVAFFAATLSLLTGALAETAQSIRVSQKERAFTPSEISIGRGKTLQIVNDDYDLMHHAYVESDIFSFDSGDQQPGSRTDILFPVSGDFKVLCGIHPKMKLTVHVR